jgi:chromosome segregation ATPase
MSKLTKEQLGRITDIAEKLRGAHSDLKNEIEDINGEIRALNERLDIAYGNYNQTVADAQSVRDEIASDLQNEFDEKSEKAQESEKGQAMQDAISEWESVEIDEAEYNTLDELEELPDECDPADNIENAPQEW